MKGQDVNREVLPTTCTVGQVRSECLEDVHIHSKTSVTQEAEDTEQDPHVAGTGGTRVWKLQSGGVEHPALSQEQSPDLRGPRVRSRVQCGPASRGRGGGDGHTVPTLTRDSTVLLLASS